MPRLTRMAAPERSGCTVLVADDDALVRSVLRMALASQGHQVLEARDAPSAIATALESDDVHLVVLDLNMPGGHAVDTLTSLRTNRPDIPVLVLSGALELPPELAEAGVAFARKPVELDDFLGTIAELLTVNPTAAAAPTEV